MGIKIEESEKYGKSLNMNDMDDGEHIEFTLLRDTPLRGTNSYGKEWFMFTGDFHTPKEGEAKFFARGFSRIYGQSFGEVLMGFHTGERVKCTAARKQGKLGKYTVWNVEQIPTASVDSGDEEELFKNLIAQPEMTENGLRQLLVNSGVEDKTIQDSIVERYKKKKGI